jgi:hypothetical protein
MEMQVTGAWLCGAFGLIALSVAQVAARIWRRQRHRLANRQSSKQAGRQEEEEHEVGEPVMVPSNNLVLFSFLR